MNDETTPGTTPETVVADRLRLVHFDGEGCGTYGSNACSNCHGPSPMSAQEVAEEVVTALRAAGLLPPKDAPSAFWDDLNEDMDDPKYRAAHEESAAEIAALDGIANATDRLVAEPACPCTCHRFPGAKHMVACCDIPPMQEETARD